MEWVILFIASWILFFLLIDWKRLKTNHLCGLLAIFIQMSVDTNFISHQLYLVKDATIKIMTSSAFFVFGPVFVIGTLIAQYQPKKKVFRVLNILVLAGLYTLQEVNLLRSGVLIYKNWDIFGSILVNVSAITTLSWFSMVVLSKKEHAAH